MFPGWSVLVHTHRNTMVHPCPRTSKQGKYNNPVKIRLPSYSQALLHIPTIVEPYSSFQRALPYTPKKLVRSQSAHSTYPTARVSFQSLRADASAQDARWQYDQQQQQQQQLQQPSQPASPSRTQSSLSMRGARTAAANSQRMTTAGRPRPSTAHNKVLQQQHYQTTTSIFSQQQQQQRPQEVVVRRPATSLGRRTTPFSSSSSHTTNSNGVNVAMEAAREDEEREEGGEGSEEGGVDAHLYAYASNSLANNGCGDLYPYATSNNNNNNSGNSSSYSGGVVVGGGSAGDEAELLAVGNHAAEEAEMQTQQQQQQMQEQEQQEQELFFQNSMTAPSSPQRTLLLQDLKAQVDKQANKDHQVLVGEFQKILKRALEDHTKHLTSLFQARMHDVKQVYSRKVVENNRVNDEALRQSNARVVRLERDQQALILKLNLAQLEVKVCICFVFFFSIVFLSCFLTVTSPSIFFFQTHTTHLYRTYKVPTFSRNSKREKANKAGYEKNSEWWRRLKPDCTP